MELREQTKTSTTVEAVLKYDLQLSSTAPARGAHAFPARSAMIMVSTTLT